MFVIWPRAKCESPRRLIHDDMNVNIDFQRCSLFIARVQDTNMLITSHAYIISIFEKKYML